MTRPLCDMTLDGAPAGWSPAGAAAERAVAAALTAGAALLASEQLGLAERCLDTTVEYVKNRHQFGRPVGSFQALKHRLADLWVDVTQARAVARYAADCAGHRRPGHARSRSALAKAACSRVAVRAPRSACSCTAASASPGSTRRTCTSSGPRADSIALGTAGPAPRGAGAGWPNLPAARRPGRAAR